MLDVASKKYMIWFDAHQNLLFEQALDKVCNYKNPIFSQRDRENRLAIEPIVMKEFLSRVCLLALTLEAHPKLSPQQWRNIQLSASDVYQAALINIQIHLRAGKFCSTDNLNAMVSYVHSKTNESLWLAIDEAAELVNSSVKSNYFYNGDGTQPRPFLTPILDTLKDYFPHILIAGTYVSLATVHYVPSDFLLFTRFRANTKTDSLKLLKRLLKDHSNLSAVANIITGLIICVCFDCSISATKNYLQNSWFFFSHQRSQSHHYSICYAIGGDSFF